VRQLIPLFVEAGVDGIMPFEVAAGMDVREIRRQWPELVICGGIDKREIAKGRQAIDRELEAKLPEMFRSGGYLPSMDHHVPPEVSYADFKYYLERTQELYQQFGRG
jgi:uroporphyrinogen decarboxylase